jgi:hypothetical protein
MKNSKQPINPIVMENTLPGLSKREYFALLAMQGLISNSSIVPKIQPNNGEDLELLSMASVAIADKLLNELEND